MGQCAVRPEVTGEMRSKLLGIALDAPAHRGIELGGRGGRTQHIGLHARDAVVHVPAQGFEVLVAEQIEPGNRVDQIYQVFDEAVAKNSRLAVVVLGQALADMADRLAQTAVKVVERAVEALAHMLLDVAADPLARAVAEFGQEMTRIGHRDDAVIGREPPPQLVAGRVVVGTKQSPEVQSGPLHLVVVVGNEARPLGDLRAIRTSLIKAHLAQDFSAPFDLCVFQMARAVFRAGYQPHALDITVVETPDRPPFRDNDEHFGEAARGEGMLELNRSVLSLDWLHLDDDGEAFQALRELSPDRKQSLFAACVARTVKGQLAFEASARPELEATVARLDIDFAGLYRPDAELFWSRLNKANILDIALKTHHRSRGDRSPDIIVAEGAVAPGDHQRAAYPRRGFPPRSERFEDSMETGEMES